MAKKKNPKTKQLQEWKNLITDFRECCPQWLPLLFRGGTDSKGSSISRAADYFEIDLSQAADSQLLLQVLAEIVFPRTGRQSGSAGWGVERLAALGIHWREIERANPGISDSRAAEKIKKRYPQKYQSAGAIRPRLPDARLMLGAGNLSAMSVKKGMAVTSGIGAEMNEIHAKVMSVARLAEIVAGGLGGLSREKRRAALKRLPSLVSKLEKYLDLKNKRAEIIESGAAKVAAGAVR